MRMLLVIRPIRLHDSLTTQGPPSHLLLVPDARPSLDCRADMNIPVERIGRKGEVVAWPVY